MAGHNIFDQGRTPCFVTCVTTDWLPLFIDERYFRIVTDSLAFCRQSKGLLVHVYLIMPNHAHLILSSTGDPLSSILGDLKRFTSRQISAQARRDGLVWAMRAFAGAADREGHSYKVWQDGNNPKEMYSPDFFLQKAEYIHNNPVRKGLVLRAADWKYSSARNYELGDESVFEIDRIDL